jgi:exonuclease III
VTREHDDIILLSDIRLNSNKQIAATLDITKRFLYRGYNFIHNSRENSRGVGTYTCFKKIRLYCTVHDEYRDMEGNILLLDITIQGVRMTVGSIYGPNNDNEDFFNTISDTCNRLNNRLKVIGGDWNTTVDGSPVRLNIDTLNMVDIPSNRRSRWLKGTCDNLNLSDPYRHFYPDRKEYTYIPNALANNNRSRLDFFVISQQQLLSCKNCTIAHHLDSLLFDHKSVRLTFRYNKASNKQIIKDNILSDIDLPNYVRCQVVEHYLQHATICDNFPLDTKVQFLQTIGQIVTKHNSIRKTLLEIASGEANEGAHAAIAALRNEVVQLLEGLPRIDYFESLDLTCDDKSFFETLIMSVKNVTLSAQHAYYKIKTISKETLKKRIRFLKQNFVPNQDEIFALEVRLSNLVDTELREELSLLKNFERLNYEKITPYFMALAKQPDSDALLSDIRNTDGTEFIDCSERERYISDYYKELYENKDHGGEQGSIDDFLGEVAQHPDVVGSKLNEVEKAELDRPLTLRELDISIKKAKKNTAPGIDGVSNRFINKFWEFYRVPLYKYAVNCYETGSLTDNFRSTKIRLIPKKGNLTNLKNWRPISLLNCFYKIISRVIANRLQKHMDKLTKVCQKGYSSSKQCQEVLINIIDSVNKIKVSGNRGALVSLDIKKAFDSTSHRYLQSVYNFFNFGPNFIRWLNLISTNRRACIILDNKLYSSFFDLERGNAQGDTASPYIFNLGFQILLFKINYDLQIQGIIEQPTIPPGLPPVPHAFIRSLPLLMMPMRY